MRNTSKRGIAIVLAVIMVVGMAVPAMALTADNETTETSTTSAILDTTTLTEPHNSSKSKTIEVDGDSNTNTSSLTNPETAFTLRVLVNDSSHPQDGEVLYETTENWSVQTVANAPDHYNLTVNNTEWGNELEYNATENVSVNFKVIFNESESDESVVNITPTVDPQAQPDARIEVADSERQLAGFSSSNDSGVLASIFSSESIGAAKANQSIGVTSNTENITVDIDNQSAVDALGESVASKSDGTLLTSSYVMVNGQMVPVFVGSAGDQSWLDTGSEAYAVVDTSSDEVTIKNANATFSDSTSSVDVSVTTNEAAGFWQTRSMLSSYGASPVTAATTAANSIDTNGDPFDDRNVPGVGA